MGFFNKYPYTDFHELNADWLLNEMKKLDTKVDAAIETISASVYSKVMEDIGPMFTDLQNEFASLQMNFDGLEGQVDAIEEDFEDLSADVEAKLNIIRNYVDAQAVACREYTNSAIEQNNEYLLNQMEINLSNIKVINFFTGERVTIQAMFDYLAGFHASGSIDYNTMAQRAKTYNELAAFNKTYTELVNSADSWYI